MPEEKTYYFCPKHAVIDSVIETGSDKPGEMWRCSICQRFVLKVPPGKESEMPQALNIPNADYPLTSLQREALIAQLHTIFYRSASARELLLTIGLSTPAHSQALFAVQDVIEASRKLALYLEAPLPSDLPSSKDFPNAL